MGAQDDDFVALFRKEYPGIQRAVALILGDADRAQEVAQEAFARAFARWRRVSSYDRPGAWIRRVAIRLALRSRGRPGERTLSCTDVSRVAEPPDGADLDLREALGGLSKTQRAAVVLHYLDDLAVADVAAALGCRESTARVHLHRARRVLAGLLSEEVPSESR